MWLIQVSRKVMFFSFVFLQAYSDENQKTWSNQTVMQNTGYFE